MKSAVYMSPERIPVDTRRDIWIEPGEVVGAIEMTHKNVSLKTFCESSGAFRSLDPAVGAGEDGSLTFVTSRRIIYGDFSKGQFIEAGEPVATVKIESEGVSPGRFFGLLSQGKLTTSLPDEELEEEEITI